VDAVETSSLGGGEKEEDRQWRFSREKKDVGWVGGGGGQREHKQSFLFEVGEGCRTTAVRGGGGESGSEREREREQRAGKGQGVCG